MACAGSSQVGPSSNTPVSASATSPAERSQYAVQICRPAEMSGWTKTVPRPRHLASRSGTEESTRSRMARSSAPNACGSRSAIRSGCGTASIRHSGPPCSHSSWRHRPHGINGCPSPPTQESATRRPPPVACREETTPHSAQSPTPYAAFSTLQPTTMRPSSTSPAAPTGKSE